MTVRGMVRGQVRVFDDVDAMMRYVQRLGQHQHPERYAPDGTMLLHVHPRSGGTSWAERLGEWHRTHDPEPEVPDVDEEVTYAPPQVTVAVDMTETDAGARDTATQALAPEEEMPRRSSVDDIPI